MYSAVSPLFTPLSSTDELPVSFLEDLRLEEVKCRRWQREKCVWGSEVECSHLKVSIVRNVVKVMGTAYKYTAIIWHEPLLGVNW